MLGALCAPEFHASGKKLVRLEFPHTEVQHFGDVAIVCSTFVVETEENGKRESSSGRATELRRDQMRFPQRGLLASVVESLSRMSWRQTAAVRRRSSIRNNGPKRTRSRPTAANCCTVLSPSPQTMRRCGCSRSRQARHPRECSPAWRAWLMPASYLLGHWIAYVSAQSGRAQVYLQAFPGPGERVQVSTEGGSEPVWAPNGSELYFRTPTKSMAVDVKGRPALAVGKPRLLFEGEFRADPP